LNFWIIFFHRSSFFSDSRFFFSQHHHITTQQSKIFIFLFLLDFNQFFHLFSYCYWIIFCSAPSISTFHSFTPYYVCCWLSRLAFATICFAF
jgi:hypothetical protein